MSDFGKTPPRMAGRACPLCPATSDVDLFGNRQHVVTSESMGRTMPRKLPASVAAGGLAVVGCSV